MKKVVSLILVMALAATLAACGKTAPETTVTTVPAVGGPATALELMETVWNGYADDQKFSIFGGSTTDPTDGGPGNFALTDENISYSLLIPADQLGNVTEAASMTHMMNSNTFTAAAFKLADNVSAADFSGAMKEAIVNNQWICGFPEQVLIQEVPGYVVVVFGAMDLIEVFKTNLTVAYPQAVELVNEPLM